MTTALVILSAIGAFVVGVLEYFRRRARTEANRVVAESMAKVLAQAEREKTQLTDPNKTPTPQESQNAFRAYRDAGR